MSQQWDAIIVGGGPAGSTTAGYLSMWGHKVLLLEKSHFPRHHVGESLLPSMMPVIKDFGLMDELEKAKFPRKTGGTFSWGKTNEPWDIIFNESPFLPSPYAYHVERSVFDKILLDHADRRGAEVRQGCTVRSVIQENDRIVGLTYAESKDGPEHEVRAPFVIDASGSRSVIGSRVTTRRYDDKMRHLAYYGYFRNVPGPQGIRVGHIYVLTGKKGWCWYIPMNSPELGQASVGVVTGAEFKEEVAQKGIEAFYHDALESTPHMAALLGSNPERIGELRTIRDWATPRCFWIRSCPPGSRSR
jgi:halogenation protein CepH